MAWRDAMRQPAEGQAFLRHRVVGARSGQDHAVEDADGGEDHQRGDEGCAARAGHGLRGVGGDARGGVDAVEREQVQIGGIQRDVEGRDDERSDEEGARDGAAGSRVSPAA